jgi:hypothetical protein
MPHTPTFTLPIPSEALLSLAVGASAGISTRIAQLAEQQAKAEADAPAVMAKRLLNLIEGIADYDEHAASHLLIGLLRLAARQPLLTVERTALRIAGLVDPVQDALNLTSEGQGLLALIGSGKMPVSGAAAVEKAQTPAQVVFEATPFATMRFGEQLFEVADGPIEDSLAFRMSESDPWQILSADRSSGWDVIGGEMLAKTRDALADYIMMHTVRLEAPERGAVAHRFELDQWVWFIRIRDHIAELAIGEDGAWQEIHSQVQEKTIRDLGIRAAITMIPDFADSLQTEITIWLRRMAHAASITPVMYSAA